MTQLAVMNPLTIWTHELYWDQLKAGGGISTIPAWVLLTSLLNPKKTEGLNPDTV